MQAHSQKWHSDDLLHTGQTTFVLLDPIISYYTGTLSEVASPMASFANTEVKKALLDVVDIILHTCNPHTTSAAQVCLLRARGAC